MNEYFTFEKEQKDYLREGNSLVETQLSKFATQNSDAVRKYNNKKNESIFRQEFGIDIDKILHNALYNRYVDKTQVFSFYKNDDITRRALHVQLVSRIASIIGHALRLNTDLIEAIALGHDIGHTPFGHKGEEFLNELYHEKTNKFFNHNVHSVRVLHKITGSNLCLQTYDGILCHCGEKCFQKYEPAQLEKFEEFERILELCYTEKDHIRKLHPATLEGCVVRISDMIAYVGKDRQDASKAGLLNMKEFPADALLGNSNAEIIDRMVTNIVKNSIDKNYLSMDEEVFQHFESMQKDNYSMIYKNQTLESPYYDIIKPMMEKIYVQCLSDVEKSNFKSPIFQHHLNHPIIGNYCRDKMTRKIVEEPNEIVVDYISSMTDDYFLDLYKQLFGDDELSQKIQYMEYFKS